MSSASVEYMRRQCRIYCIFPIYRLRKPEYLHTCNLLTGSVTLLYFWSTWYLQGGFYLKCVFQRNHSLSGWPRMLSNENAGSHVLFLSRIPFRSKFLTCDLPFCVCWLQSLCSLSGYRLHNMGWEARCFTWALKTHTSDPRSPAAAFFFFSALPHGKWDLSSWTKGWTHTCPSTPCHGKTES